MSPILSPTDSSQELYAVCVDTTNPTGFSHRLSTRVGLLWTDTVFGVAVGKISNSFADFFTNSSNVITACNGKRRSTLACCPGRTARAVHAADFDCVRVHVYPCKAAAT